MLLKPEDLAIDATAGNGHDTLFLAKLCSVIAIDIQEEALKNTEALLKSVSVLHSVRLIFGSHETFPLDIKDESVKLIVYNLGYLPKGNKSITTLSETTLKSLQGALSLLQPGGLITIISYSGHDEGRREEFHILEFVKGLPSKKWLCCHYRALNRKDAPCLTLIQKANRSLL